MDDERNEQAGQNRYFNWPEIVLLICFFIVSISVLAVSDAGIMTLYARNKKYGKGAASKEIRKIRYKIADSLEIKFMHVDKLLVIEEQCYPFSFISFVHSKGKAVDGIFFRQDGLKGELRSGNSVYPGDTYYYQRILDVIERDSLQHYKRMNDLAFDASDEMCRMSVYFISVSNGKYHEEQVIFEHPIAFINAITRRK